MDRALPQKLQLMNNAWYASTWPTGDLQLGCSSEDCHFTFKLRKCTMNIHKVKGNKMEVAFHSVHGDAQLGSHV